MKIFKIKFKDSLYAVKADTLYDALYKLSQTVNIVKCNDRVSPMIYHGLHELGYTTEQLSGKSEEEINQLYYSKKSAQPTSSKSAVASETKKHSGAVAGTTHAVRIKQIDDAQSFSDLLSAARDKLKEDGVKGYWRVDKQSSEDLIKMHAEMFVSENGSTYAIKPDGDIIAVCKSGNDKGSMVIQHAIKNGGDRLDSFSGNNEFYMRNGFEPVCYIDFDPSYHIDGFDPESDTPEPVVFYRYTGNHRPNITWDDIKDTVHHVESNDWDDGYKYRDEVITNVEKNK